MFPKDKTKQGGALKIIGNYKLPSLNKMTSHLLTN